MRASIGVVGDPGGWSAAISASRCSPRDKLFRSADGTTPVYLSFGSFFTKRFGGASCYRTITGLKTPQKGPRVYVKEDEAPWTNAWATPSGVEFAVLRAAMRCSAGAVFSTVPQASRGS